jgi:hypothetical protein
MFWLRTRGAFELPAIVKPVKLMRGWPVVMPLCTCQWSDQVVSGV